MAAPKTGTTRVSTTAAPKVAVSKTGMVTIPGIVVERSKLLIVGTAPLIVHKFSAKAQEMILAKHKGEASLGREAKDPQANFEAARHRLPDGSDGFPAGGLKAAIVAACGKDTGIAATRAKGAIRVLPDDPGTNLCRILMPPGAEPEIDEAIVRNQSGVVDIRHRPRFWPWACRFEVEFMPPDASLARVLQAIQVAGYRVGIGEWRPSSPTSRSGHLGTFRLASEAELEGFEGGDLWSVLDPPKPRAVEPTERRRKAA